MKFEELVNDYNTSDLTLSSLLQLIGKEVGQEFSPFCTKWFSKDIMNKNRITKPINIVQIGNKYSFASNEKVLFLINKRPYDKFKSNDSLLRSSAFPYMDKDGSVYDIYNDQFLLGTNGLYESEDVFFNKYRYVTFDNKGRVYYDALVDKDNGTIKKMFFDRSGMADAKYFYNIKKRYSDTNNSSHACNRIEKFLDEDFPKLKGYMYKQTYADLIDQYYYDIQLVNKTYKHKDLYITNKSKIVLENRDKNPINGLIIKASTNRNKEDFIALFNPTLPELKLLCVTDFVNGSKLNKSLSKYINLELKSWFYNLDCKTLKDEKLILIGLGEKLLEINKFINEQVCLYKTKNKYVESKRVIGSALGLSLITKNNTYFINYGDTRIYSTLGEDLSRLTADDTIVWDLYKNNVLTYDETINYQKGSILTNYIGNPETYMKLPELYSIKNDSYDKLFVFSDGVTDNLTDETLTNIINVNNGGEIIREIVNQAYKRQFRHDDITGCCYTKK